MNVQCPFCNQVISLPDNLGGQTVPCGRCSKKLALPVVAELAPPSPLPFAASAAPLRRPVGKSWRGMPVWAWVLGGLFLFCCGGPMLLLPSAAERTKQAKQVAEHAAKQAEAEAEAEAKRLDGLTKMRRENLSQLAKALDESKKSARTTTNDMATLENEHTVTYQNFLQIQNGMDSAECWKLLGLDYEVLSESEIGGSRREMWQWKHGFSRITVAIQDGKVMHKSQFGLK